MRKNFKVIKIINEFKIVINGGADKGIKRGNVFEIYIPGEEVLDPETNESLGTLDFVKAVIEVTQVFPKMSICENNAFKTTSYFEIASTFSRKERESLNIETTEITGGLNGTDRKIRVGDSVRESIG